MEKTNCTVVVERKEGDTIKQTIFSFDDYRVAIAIENLLHEMRYVKSEYAKYKEG